MNEFNTLEQATELLKATNGLDSYNNIFVLYKDMQKSTGMVSGMEYPYEGLLVNETENGFHMVPLNQKGLVLAQKIEKMTADPDKAFFIPKETIDSVTIKNLALLNSKDKRISIKAGDKNYLLIGRKTESTIAYHTDNFAKFVEKYSK